MAEQSPDLTETIVSAATAAIRSQKRSLDVDRRAIRSVTLELNLRSNGKRDPTVSDAECYIMRRVRTDAILGLSGTGRG